MWNSECFTQTSFRDYLVALQCYRLENPADFRILSSTSFLVDYPFAKRLDKLRIPSAVKKNWADGVTTMFPRQRRFARDPAVFAAKPTPDVTVERVSDLLGFGLPALLSTSPP